ncbi:MAG: hypothetical protein AB7F72_08570 [Afipia sp.]
MSGIEKHQDFVRMDFVSSRFRTHEMVNGVFGRKARDQRRSDNAVIGARRGCPGFGQQPHRLADCGCHDRRLRWKFHHGRIGDAVFLIGEIDFVLRQRRPHHDNVEVYVPAAELLDGEVPEQIGMQRE